MIRWTDLRRGDALVSLDTKMTCVIYILADAPDPHDKVGTEAVKLFDDEIELRPIRCDESYISQRWAVFRAPR